MKFMISVDCEGAACVTGSPGKNLSGSKDFSFACRQATFETNSCIKGLFDSGAKEVYVKDSHGQGSNLLYEMLDKRCRIISGQDFDQRFPELDSSFTGLLMVGYHSMEGTKNGVLAHTYSSETYKNIKVNSINSGEILLDASVAGEYQVPLIFLSGDLKTCEEGLDKMPWIETVSTKTGYGRNSAVNRHPYLAREEIYTKTVSAVKNIENMKPFRFESPAEIEIEFKTVFKTLKSLLKKRRGWKLKGLKKIGKTLPDMSFWNC